MGDEKDPAKTSCLTLSYGFFRKPFLFLLYLNSGNQMVVVMKLISCKCRPLKTYFYAPLFLLSIILMISLAFILVAPS